MVVSSWFSFTAPAQSQSGAPPAFAWEESVPGEEEGKLTWPVAVSVAGPDEFAVADNFGNRLLLFRLQEGAAGWKMETSAALPAPATSMTFDGEKYVVSLRQKGGLLAVERPRLQFRKISTPTQMIPGPVATGPSGSLWVSDAATNNVVMMDSAGKVSQTIPVAGWVSAVTAGPGGGVYVATAQPAQISQYAANGDLVTSWSPLHSNSGLSWPTGLLVDAGGNALVLDRQAGKVLVFQTGGRLAGSFSRRGWESGLLLGPSGFSRFPDGRIAIADLGNGRIQIFRPVKGTAGP